MKELEVVLAGYPGGPKCHPERLHGREAGTGHTEGQALC